jgi:hypothetical protein
VSLTNIGVALQVVIWFSGARRGDTSPVCRLQAVFRGFTLAGVIWVAPEYFWVWGLPPMVLQVSPLSAAGG